MVDLTAVKASNGRLPTRLTAVFVGGTSGIGEYTLLAFANRCPYPTAYFVGRSQAAADRILANLNRINPKGTYHFIKSDVAFVKNVDAVCEEIKSKEGYMNILCLSQGTMIQGIETEEGLNAAASLILHSRTRFALNLLPLLQAAPILRRVLSISFGTKEGPMPINDLQMRNVPAGQLLKFRGQAASGVTLSLEQVAKRAPGVSFIHDFPGPVRSNIARGGGIANFVMRALFKVIGPFVYIPNDESGERHLFLATSAVFPAKDGGANGVLIDGGLTTASGTNGEIGSGVYVADEKCESTFPNVVKLLTGLREERKDEWVWKEIRGDYLRITGKESV
ncbi:hypothetical protein BU26DRAFT_559780 [Trematosphaeria pertusa]|uniref:NAD(P)-binding protein n=1 Tax=Trematosphaeria pertusa TaxID=390896 RepID=A0A6A6IZZ8_9PLEO|nr:uncharacterized protein BU26DRAFT_559780 [Trematosphaeria pertusa]KAF2255160.1 hypothetical protein BU26DRAFT_559780 [Trematosphaeria pertusa]